MVDINNAVNRRSILSSGVLGSAALITSSLLSGTAKAQRGDGKMVIVKTSEGSLRGQQTPTGNIFKGIRYGENTSGASRFSPPVPVKPWKGVRDAFRLGPPSPQQSGSDTQAWTDPNPGSEDCLFLNVWSPKEFARRPVMVFFHGGGYTFGSGGTPGYEGSKLAERGDVVVVTVNHRLNAFGYLYLGGLSDQFAESANLGQLDLIAALRWIQRNIAAFGGDPSNVTLFGESGGGAKISMLLAMPMARGLFHKAIIQSCSVLQAASEASATDNARAVIQELGLSAGNISQILSVSTDRLLNACIAANKKRATTGDVAQRRNIDNLPFSPFQHAKTLPYHPTDYAARLLWKDVPLLVGVNEGETAYYLDPDPSGSIPVPADDSSLEREIMRFRPSTSPMEARRLIFAYRQQLPNASNQELLIVITSGVYMWGNGVRQAELKTEMNGAPVYMYQYGWRDPLGSGAWAVHGVELPFIFDKLDLAQLWDETDTPVARARLDPTGMRFKLRDATIAAWSQFARTGSPGNALLPEWPAYSVPTRMSMRFDGESRLLKDPFGPEIRSLVAP